MRVAVDVVMSMLIVLERSVKDASNRLNAC